MTEIRKSKIYILVLLIVLLPLVSPLFNSFQNNRNEKNIPKSSDFWVIGPLHIEETGGGDYTWAEVEAQPWCNGTGTFTDPYVIQNLTIDVQGGEYGIKIQNSNAYFQLLNCRINNSGNTIDVDACIKLENTTNGQISKNNLANTGVGLYSILLIDSDGNFIDYNDAINNNNIGIVLINSDSNSIIYNNISNNGQHGIYAKYSDLNNFSHNNIQQNTIDGFLIEWSCDNNTIFNNTISDNPGNGIRIKFRTSSSNQYNLFLKNYISNNLGTGIKLESSGSDNLIYYNYIISNVLQAQDDGANNEWNNTVIGNYWDDYADVDVNDDGIGDSPYSLPGAAGSHDNFPIWDDGPEPIYIDGAATGVGAKNWSWAENQPWCTGLGTFASPYIIEDISRDGRGNGFGISIQNSDVYFEVRNCNISNAGFSWPDSGILLNNVDNAKIIGNILTDTNFVGIHMDNSNNNSVIGNDASFADLGILMTNSEFNHIISNTINDNLENAINVDDFSNNNTISGNTANGNGYAISIYSDSNNNTVSGNTLINNNVGVSILDHCDNNKVLNNYLEDNGAGVAIHNFNSTINLIYNNTFLINTVNAEDDSFNVNYWNYGILGNYWDDYGGVDTNDDGIGDTAYVISGLRGRLDYFTIWDDGDDIYPIISLNSPSGGSLFGTDAPTYSLNLFDLNLNMSWYTLNGTATRYFFTPTNGINLVAIDETGWDTFSTGSMLMTFYVNDSGGNPASVSNLINKDANYPYIVVNSPLGGMTFGLDAPEFNLTIYDENLLNGWYTLRYSGYFPPPHFFTPINGINLVPIDEISWDALPEGNITVTFFVNDTAGNMHGTQVIINKDLPSSDPEPAIPFGNYYFIFIGIGIASLLLVEHRKRKK